MHRFVSMKQSCGCARVRVRALAPARRRTSDHAGPHELIAARAVAEAREHLMGRAETLGHWRLRWRASLARGSDLRQRPSRAAHRTRLHRHRTKTAEAIRSTRGSGLRRSRGSAAPMAPAIARPLLFRGQSCPRQRDARRQRDSGRFRDSRPCAPRRAELHPGADLGPNRPPHRAPRRLASCSHLTELPPRQLRCARALRPSTRVRDLLDGSLLPGAYPFRARFGRP